MPAFVRLALPISLTLFVAACGSSGSQVITSELGSGNTFTVTYPLRDSGAITAARTRIANSAQLAESHPILTSRRDRIVDVAQRYLSTGPLLQRGSLAPTATGVTCSDAGSTSTRGGCVFTADHFRNAITLHTGQGRSSDAGNGIISLRTLSLDRQAVMTYREIRMVQERRTGANIRGSGDTATSTNYQYIGYGGLLDHSLFYVNAEFFPNDDQRLLNAAIGQIFDNDPTTESIEAPSTSLSGTGVMVGIESRVNVRDRHFVQGDAAIAYDGAADTIDVTMSEIRRLSGTEAAWYNATANRAQLSWTNVPVTNSMFTASENNKEMSGSLFGETGSTTTTTSYEAAGVFHHIGDDHYIQGAFGAELTPSTN